MSRRRSETVSEIVEKYVVRYRQSERDALKKMILLEHKDINPRTLDRHLKKAFEGRIKLYTHPIEREIKPEAGQAQKPYAAPKIHFFATQNVIGYPLIKRQLPVVGFNLWNRSEYPARVRVEVRSILGGRDLGLIDDQKGYYNGRTVMEFEPGEGFANGSFKVPEECVKSSEELTVEVRVTAMSPGNREYRVSPKSWTYKRDENSWYYEPRAFTDDK